MPSIVRTAELHSLSLTEGGQAKLTQLWFEATGVPLDKRDSAIDSYVSVPRKIADIVRAEAHPTDNQ